VGSKSSEVTVGYKYLVGMHQALCHGPVDKAVRIRVDERTAWQGTSTGGRIDVYAEDLFGGEGREGGVSGAVDFLPGGPDQTANDYLAAHLPGGNVPGFRGVCAAVLRQVYCGMNPYLKSWAWRIQRIQSRTNGEPQWQPTLAPISQRAFGRNSSIFIAMDRSGSMAGARLATLKAAMFDVLELIRPYATGTNGLDVMLNAWAATSTTIVRNNITSAGIDDLQSFVAGRTAAGGTDFVAAVTPALSFFAPTAGRKNVLVFVTDGEPSPIETAASAQALIADFLDQSSGTYSFANQNEVYVYGINIAEENTSYTALIDNTPDDGVPIISEDDASGLTSAVQTALFASFAYADMNPAHIIRECLTDSVWGMGYAEADIDDDAFLAAADVLFSEGMGISLLWDRQASIQDFIQEIVKHIDAVLYVDRRSGKFVLRLVRDDYVADDLPVLDESNIEAVTDYKRPAIGELVNSVTVNFWDSDNEVEGSLTVQDTALAEAQGSTINTTIQYPGFTYKDLAARVAGRDLRALSTPFISCTITANRTATELNVGDAFKLSWPDFGAQEVIMRVNTIAVGDGQNHRVKIKAVQDVFATPAIAFIAPAPVEWQNPQQLPLPVPYQAAFEMPYLEAVQRLGQATVDDQLASDPEQGFLCAAAPRPTGATINAQVHVGGTRVSTLDFCPAATLSEDLDEQETEIDFADGIDIDLVRVGSWVQCDNELMVVQAISSGSVTVKRGALDTVPATHAMGGRLFFWDDLSVNSSPVYLDGETISVKLLTVTGSGVLPAGSATAMPVTFASRAIRPYPPGRVQINDFFYPTDAQAEDLVVTWVHRNRVQQTAGTLLGFMDSGVTPEVGTTYRIWITDQTDALVYDETGISGTTHTIPVAEVPSGTFCRVNIASERAGFQSLQHHSIYVNLDPLFGDALEFVLDDTTAPPDGDALDFTL
jgi:hypothetical protein